MKVTSKLIIFLNSSDLKDDSINKDLIDLRWHDFKSLTKDMLQTAWYIDYSDIEGSIVLKNKISIEGGTIIKT